jgi:murein DD-endopeptidase MepM/ murein hydrolase activator NlpD
VRIGDAVIGGQVIGFVGLTGITTGPHLHFAVLSGGQPIDPLSLLASR